MPAHHTHLQACWIRFYSWGPRFDLPKVTRQTQSCQHEPERWLQSKKRPSSRSRIKSQSFSSGWFLSLLWNILGDSRCKDHLLWLEGRSLSKGCSQIGLVLELSCVCACILSHFSHVTLWNPMDCSPPGSFVHGILQARILEWVVIPFSRGSSRTRDWTHVSYASCTGRRVLVPPGKPTVCPAVC